MRTKTTYKRPVPKPRILPPVRIDVHVHHHGLPTTDGLKEQIMAVSKQIAEFSARVDAATTEIASDLKALRDRLADGISAEDAAVLTGIADKLDALGKDPETV